MFCASVRYSLLLWAMVFIAMPAGAQTRAQMRVAIKFRQTKNDSVFSARYSKKRYTPHIIAPTLFGVLGWQDSVMFHARKGEMFGPYRDSGRWIWYKVTRIDSAHKFCAGSITVKFENNDTNDATARNKAQMIMRLAAAGQPFDDLCRRYAEDGNHRPECSMGYFFPGTMEKRFEDALHKHSTGDLYTISTASGWHVVKVLGPPVKTRCRVTLTVLCL